MTDSDSRLFTPKTTVSFNGVKATPTIVSGTYLTVKVPTGAKTGYVTVTTVQRQTNQQPEIPRPVAAWGDNLPLHPN